MLSRPTSFTWFQNQVACINLGATDELPARVFRHKLVVDPGFEEVPAFGNVVGPQRVEKEPASIISGDGASPGRGLALLFTGFEPEENVNLAHLLRIFNLDNHFCKIRLANTIVNVAL